MPKNTPERADQPLRETEAAAYHAFREWPLLLVLRQKELAALQPSSQSTDQSQTPASDKKELTDEPPHR